ncbi:hypothetical protein EOD39_18031 [Acipenser ruthenus]|uniref:Uncharacterized protein n=1 Tax=Acipenser ruthenus TaxID=7906 RepID=A0A444V1R6_ACIRT|nr:hypothetical protein EOD39_18031 [Acipenser ruthenus]
MFIVFADYWSSSSERIFKQAGTQEFDHRDFAPCPQFLPIHSPRPTLTSCELNKNTRRCHQQQLPFRQSCRTYQTCDHAVLISVEEETDAVYPATEKELIRSQLSKLCRSVHCADSLVLCLNSPARPDGSMLLWDVNRNGIRRTVSMASAAFGYISDSSCDEWFDFDYVPENRDAEDPEAPWQWCVSEKGCFLPSYDLPNQSLLTTPPTESVVPTKPVFTPNPLEDHDDPDSLYGVTFTRILKTVKGLLASLLEVIIDREIVPVAPWTTPARDVIAVSLERTTVMSTEGLTK